MKLIINADDFGKSDNVNNSILFLHKKGIVSSTTIIANGKCFDEAVDISRSNPNLGVGVHLCLDGPYNISKKHKTILDADTLQFYSNSQIIRKIKMFSIDESEVFSEYCLQIEKVLHNGIKISHLDHHHHLHLYFPILGTMIKVAKRYRIPFIRSQRIILNPQNNILKYSYRSLHQFYLKRKINTIDGYFQPGVYENYSFEIQYMRLQELLRLNRNIVEIILHPSGGNDPETSFFISDEVHNLLTRQTILNYFSLQ
jgi:chitin disaccharide deacetylase